MAEPEDVGIDKQKVLQSVSGATPPSSPSPPKTTAPSPAKGEEAPPTAPPPPAAPPRVRRNRDVAATLVFFLCGLAWIIAGFAGKMVWAKFAGGGLLLLGVVSAVLLARK